MSHSGISGHDSGGYSQGHHGDGGQNVFHYSVGDNYNPLGTYLDNYRIEHLTEGLRINNGIRFAILFIAFFGWLYIVYWLRHHEPFLQQAVGTHVVTTPTSKQDRSIVASIRNAFPFKSSEDFGNIYVPSPQPVSNSSPDWQLGRLIEPQSKASSSIKVQAGEAISAPITYVDAGFDERFGQPTKLIGTSATPGNETFFSEPIVNPPQQARNLAPANINSLYFGYNIPVAKGNNALLKTLVNR